MAKTHSAASRSAASRSAASRAHAARSAARKPGAATANTTEATETASGAEAGVETLVAQVGERLKEAGIDPERVLTAARDQAGEVQDKVAAEVQAHPLRTLGLAAAAGLVVGYLSSR